MKYLKIEETNLNASNIIMGCMRINALSEQEVAKLVDTAMSEGVNFFDHADIYGGGECEEIFGRAVNLRSPLREKMIIQSKCGIVTGENNYFDFSAEHIISSVEGSLKRLGTDYLDVLLLHRPDTLFEPEEVALAFFKLRNAGKVKHFGVSNQTAYQMQLMQKYIPYRLSFNQMQLSIVHAPMIDSGIAANMATDQAVERTGGILEYSRLNNITIQAWSPMQRGYFEGVFLGDRENYPELNAEIDALAEKYEVEPEAIAVAWITRHPANMQVVLGTTNAKRFAASCKGSDIPLTRQEWYTLYKLAGRMIP